MLFEEFFKKKKINLVALNEADAGLFAEFKDHYEQMGEKSFDHTKKYWFNKLRRQYPLPAEPKVEKFKAENPIAEQTVADTLTEPTPRDAAPDLSKVEPPVNEQATPATPAPKLGFKPKFKPAVTPQLPAGETPAPVPEAENGETPKAPTPPKPGFTPRFKAGVTAAAKPNEESTDAPGTEETPAQNSEDAATGNPDATPPKMGFKPRFKAGVTSTAKPAEESIEAVKSDPAVTETKDQPAAETPAPAKLGFKPRFKAGITTTKPAEEQVEKKDEAAKEEPPKSVEPRASTPPTEPEQPAAKPAYKPRFTPNIIKRKPPEEG